MVGRDLQQCPGLFSLCLFKFPGAINTDHDLGCSTLVMEIICPPGALGETPLPDPNQAWEEHTENCWLSSENVL